MGLITKIKGWISMLFKQAKEEFGVTAILSESLDAFLTDCGRIYSGTPPWLDAEDHIRTVNMAKAICSETARLATLGIGIQIDGGTERAEWLQKQIDSIFFSLRHWVEFGCAQGTIVLKPNGDGVDLITSGEFMATHMTGDEIDGMVFCEATRDVTDDKKWWTKLEYHRFETVDIESGPAKIYRITNHVYLGDKAYDLKRRVDISTSPWKDQVEEIYIEGLIKPLFAVFRTPAANNVDMYSPLGLPIFSDAINELCDLDIAYSRNAKEIVDSKRLLLLDTDILMPDGRRLTPGKGLIPRMGSGSDLPDYVRYVPGSGAEEVYHEINPQLNTDTRLSGINALLSQIGYKCGYSNGYFVFNEQSGMVTATQVEADDRRTLQLIKDVRDKLESCLDGLLYALDKFADLYSLAPAGKYEPVYSFGDLTYNAEEDKQTWWKYVVQGKVPAWRYFVKFENMTEEEAKAMAEELRSDDKLFGDDE